MYEIKVYKIWYSDAPDDIYVGSTKHDRLSKRMKKHRSNAVRRTSLIYRTMIEKGVNNFEYCMLGSCMVSDKDGQRQFEQTYIERLKPTLNMRSAHVHEDDRKQAAKDYISEYDQRPERKQMKLERQRIARATPEYKEKHRAYEQRPDVKQRAEDRRIRRLAALIHNE